MSTNQVEKNKTWDVLESMQFKNRIKELEFDCAELQKKNEELLERCKKLASRTPEWPKGYRPTRRAVDQKKRYNERTTH